MKKTIFYGLLMVLAAGHASAVDTNGPKPVKLLTPVKFISKAEKLRAYALKEAQTSARSRRKFIPPASSQKRAGGPNSGQVTAVVVSDLGQSVNPFTSVGNGRNVVGVIPALNTVAFFRRGGPNDIPGSTDRPGNKIYYDLNTKGGADGKWQVSKGPIFSDEAYVDEPAFDPASSNFAPRYPQGQLWNRPGNSDTSNVIALSINRVLDGTNGTWGGLGKGWQKLGSTPAQTQTLWSSPDPLHFRTESMEVTSTGNVFTVEAEEDVSGTGVVFTDKFMVYKYAYNSTTNSFDSTVTYLPFANEGGEYATAVSSFQIAFGADGQTGYIAITAANNAYDSTATYLPYISKTTNGGQSWSDFKLIPINKRWNEMPSPEKDAFRDSLLVGNYVRFNESGIFRTTYDDPTKHPVDYLVNDIDLTVDKNNYAHILASLTVSGFGDTLNATFPNGITYYPGYGSWNIDLYVNNPDSGARAIYINQNVTLNGCWGDCASNDENISEANRPQITKSADGGVVVFCWYDTDTAAYPPLTNDDNSNPDLWIRTLRVGNPEQFSLGSRPRNVTKGSDKDGQVLLGNVAPVMLNSANGYLLPSTCVTLTDYDPVATTADWPMQHLYVGGVAIPPATAVDSFPVQIPRGALILKRNAEFAGNPKKTDMGMTLMPNPSSGLFSAHIELAKPGVTQIRVMNTLGQVVHTLERNLPSGGVNIPFNFRNLKPGIYFLQMQSGVQSGMHRFEIK